MADPVMNIRPDRLLSLLRIGLRLTAERDLERLLHMIIEETTEVMGADRSSLFLIDNAKQEMWAKIAQGVDEMELRFPIGVGIAGTVGMTGEPINIPDAYVDWRFNPEIDRKTGYRTRSILCVPMRNMQGVLIGAIQVLNKKSGHFSSDDAALLAALASQAAVAIENADLDRRLNELNQSLEEKVQERTADLVRANERLSVLNKELEEIAITDSLTQAFNRQYFMDRLKQEVKRAYRYGVPVSLLLIDVDHFKNVNDTHGHQAGDFVLVGMSSVIKEQLRETDLFARYGGEEFCLISTAMDLGEAVQLADRLRSLVGRVDLNYRGTHIGITVSIGVSAWEPSIKDDFEALIRRSDEALYRAKEQGRNRVCS